MACAFMMRSMFADQPYLDDTTTHGVVERRLETLTASIMVSGSLLFHHVVKDLNASFVFLKRAFSSSSASPNLRSSLLALENLKSSNSVKFCMVYSSMGSVK